MIYLFVCVRVCEFVIFCRHLQTLPHATPSMRPSVMWSAVIAAALAVLSVAVALPQVAGLEKTAAADTTSCQQHEYTAYRDCVHATRYKRQLLDAKHHTPTATTNSSSPPTVHCQRLNWDCRIACANNSKCESLCPVCPLNMAQLSADDLRTVVIESADGQHERFQVSGVQHSSRIRLGSLICHSLSLGAHRSRSQHHDHHSAHQHPEQHQSHSHSHQCHHQQCEQR